MRSTNKVAAFFAGIADDTQFVPDWWTSKNYGRMTVLIKMSNDQYDIFDRIANEAKMNGNKICINHGYGDTVLFHSVIFITILIYRNFSVVIYSFYNTRCSNNYVQIMKVVCNDNSVLLIEYETDFNAVKKN